MCERVCTNACERCEHASALQLSATKFAATLFIPTRSGNRENEYLYFFFLSFFPSFFSCFSPISIEDGKKKEKEIKFLDFEITEGKKEETNENVRIESVSLFLSGRERRYCTETQHEIPMDGMEKLLKCNTNISN